MTEQLLSPSPGGGVCARGGRARCRPAGPRQPGLEPAEEHAEPHALRGERHLAGGARRRDGHVPGEGARRRRRCTLSAGTIAAGLGTGQQAVPAVHEGRRRRLDADHRAGPAEHLRLQVRRSTAWPCADPNNTLTGFADQPGYSQLVVHGDGPGVLRREERPARHGDAPRLPLRPCTNGEREMYVYTPPGYDRTTEVPGALPARRQRRAGLDVGRSTAARRSSRTT